MVSKWEGSLIRRLEESLEVKTEDFMHVMK